MNEPSPGVSAIDKNIPSIRDAKNLFLISLILVAFAGGAIQRYDFWIGLSLTEILFILVPTALFLAKGKFSPRLALRLNYPGFAALLVGVLLGLCVWPFGLWIQTRLLALFSPGSYNILSALSEIRQVNLVYRLLVMGVLASICEETLFRGYLQTAVENKLGAKQGILWTAILFSVYHLVPTSMVAVLPGALLMSWACWRFNSIFPAVLVHFSNNFLAPYLYMRFGQITFEWFYIALAISAIVIAFTLFVTKKTPTRPRM